MSDFVYPRKAVAVVEPTSLLTNEQVRDRIIELREEGKSRKIALLLVIGEATGSGIKPPSVVKEISDRIQADIEALRRVSALDYATVSEFLAALNAAASVVPTADWTTHLQTKHGITTGTATEKFAALKAKLQAALDAQTV